MTVAQLYSLYCAAHREAHRISDGGVLRDFEVSVNGAGVTALERIVLEFALHDATNGTTLRSPESFARAVEHGRDLLGSLGLCIDGRGTAARPGSATVFAVDEAA